MAAAGGIFVRDLSQDAKLRGLDHAGRDFHAQHLETGLPLAVGAVLQAERAKLLFADFAVAKLLHALFKTRDLRFNGFAAVPFFDLSGCGDSHKHGPQICSLTKPCRPKIKKPTCQCLWLVGFGTR